MHKDEVDWIISYSSFPIYFAATADFSPLCTGEPYSSSFLLSSIFVLLGDLRMGEMMMDFRTAECNESMEMVLLEQFLPRTLLRVLLVESDDCTRQIIAALLRKCNYRVTAVSDGLMAWETLKDQRNNIDLILTEVELPSVSGFALLTLMMEHDFCKNIPVIMMSSEGTVSEVLKCMLKGAADFLIKPVRRNELRNLWQHVWRKYMLANGYATQSLPSSKDEGESAAESSRSSDYTSSSQKMKEGSDTQRVCETPYWDAERTYMENMQGLSQQKSTSSTSDNVCIEKHINGTKLNEKSPLTENQTKEKANMLGVEIAHGHEGSQANASKLGDGIPVVKAQAQDEGCRRGTNREILKAATEVHCYIDEPFERSTRAIDLIGSFDNQSKSTELSTLHHSRSKSEVAPQLDLSLTRSSDRLASLKHSDASAFSRYNNAKMMQPIFPSLASNYTELKEGVRESENIGRADASDSGSEECKMTFQGVSLDENADRYDQAFTPGEEREHPNLPASPSVHFKPEIHNFEQGYRQSDGTSNCYIYQTIREEKSQESVGQPKCGSPGDGQSASSSLCNDALNHESSSSYMNVSCHDKIAASESANCSNMFVRDGETKEIDSHRSSQREAALTKFRLKRKDRCFDKKVRYQSRKRLAEQRPRVKGQFIKQVNAANCC